MKTYPGITMVRMGLKGSGIPPINVVEWMASRGIWSYKQRIEAAEEALETATGAEAERLKAEIEEEIQAATDRFEDWASD
jgi:hypothetical protein